jgi:hypothetical protein
LFGHAPQLLLQHPFNRRFRSGMTGDHHV